MPDIDLTEVILEILFFIEMMLQVLTGVLVMEVDTEKHFLC